MREIPALSEHIEQVGILLTQLCVVQQSINPVIHGVASPAGCDAVSTDGPHYRPVGSGSTAA